MQLPTKCAILEVETPSKRQQTRRYKNKMGLVKGLKNIGATVDAEDAKFGDGTKLTWFKIADKQTFKVLFLQELDPDSENYSQKNDLGVLAVEHNNPQKFTKKALCTIDDEGRCWACEKHNENWKAGWKQKLKLYINVLVDNGKDEPFVAVLSQGNGPKSVTPALIEYATDDGTITDKWFKVKRTGSGQTDTSYLLMPTTTKAGVNVEDYELFDLNKAVREIPYDEQEMYFLDGVQDDAVAADKAAVLAGAGAGKDEEW